ncbi:MAG: AraC family transcriptional regulator [Akkermansia muciniphila]|uniref:AraC family transcriptional regulator n=1 Tax=Akkermansia TaxID=239934 RepID=UPI000C99DAE1|nr:MULTISPECIES: AraC family transcriptional regulator [Akkermansia]MCD8321231.1 AraC family transcriptional regulator [Akkermansia sp.]MCI5894242.1 AraC family transcriptional regulator [Akkermansia muciniphila]MDY4124480.1 AraC family transcriptional regulator [Akkermansia muciniphila]PNC96035.1 AraC family transcriptional regulator [Akkermansia muciniphila]
MKNRRNFEFQRGSREESLLGFTSDFPYLASRAELDKYPGRSVPWHWHQAVELFFIESGSLEYYTPKGKIYFPSGSGGMVNSNVLHRTKVTGPYGKNVQLLHIFDVSLLDGGKESRIGQKYIVPVVSDSEVELISFSSANSREEKILELIRGSFQLSEREFGYEMKLRNALSEIWMMIVAQFPFSHKRKECNKRDDKIKQMMAYVHEHYSGKIAVQELAAAAFLSEGECFRTFRDCLKMTPVEYIRSYRLQIACRMLADVGIPITDVGYSCGLGSSSYFGKVFREHFYCTPSEYRKKWRNRDI